MKIGEDGEETSKIPVSTQVIQTESSTDSVEVAEEAEVIGRFRVKNVCKSFS